MNGSPNVTTTAMMCPLRRNVKNLKTAATIACIAEREAIIQKTRLYSSCHAKSYEFGSPERRRVLLIYLHELVKKYRCSPPFHTISYAKMQDTIYLAVRGSKKVRRGGRKSYPPLLLTPVHPVTIKGFLLLLHYWPGDPCDLSLRSICPRQVLWCESMVKDSFICWSSWVSVFYHIKITMIELFSSTLLNIWDACDLQRSTYKTVHWHWFVSICRGFSQKLLSVTF